MNIVRVIAWLRGKPRGDKKRPAGHFARLAPDPLAVGALPRLSDLTNRPYFMSQGSPPPMKIGPLFSAESLHVSRSSGVCTLGVRDDHQGRGMVQDTLLHAVQRLGIQGGKTLVQDEDGGTLQQGAGDIEPTALAMGELPAGLTDDLPQPGGHAVEEWPEIQGTAQGLRRLQVCRLGGPAAAHEQVEGQRPG